MEVVNGCSTNESIAEEFRKCFHSNSVPNNQNKVDDLDRRFSDKYNAFTLEHTANCDCASYSFTNEIVFDAISCMKNGKSAQNTLHMHHFLSFLVSQSSSMIFLGIHMCLPISNMAL